MILKKRALSTICRRHGLLFNAPGGMHSSCWTWAAWCLWSQPGWAQHTRKTQNLFVCSASTELPPSPRPGARCCLSCTALAIPSLELLESAQPQPQTPLKSRAKNKNCAPCNGMCFAPKYTVFKLINNRLIANEGQCFLAFFALCITSSQPNSAVRRCRFLFQVGIQEQEGAWVSLTLLCPFHYTCTSRYSNYSFLSNGMLL